MMQWLVCGYIWVLDMRQSPTGDKLLNIIGQVPVTVACSRLPELGTIAGKRGWATSGISPRIVISPFSVPDPSCRPRAFSIMPTDLDREPLQASDHKLFKSVGLIISFGLSVFSWSHCHLPHPKNFTFCCPNSENVSKAWSYD